MNILVIAPTPYFSDRGCHIRILEQITALKNAGHTPVIYTYHLGRDAGDVEIIRSRAAKWYKKKSAGPAWGKILLDAMLLFKILRSYRKYNFDIIHAHLHEGAFIGWWAKLFMRKPLILDAQGSLVGELNSYDFFSLPGMRWMFMLIEKWVVRRADHIFTSSQASYQFIKETYPFVKFKTTLLADAVSLNIFSQVDAEEVARIRNQLHISARQPVVIYTGGLAKIKGIDYLLQAIPSVLLDHPDTQFIIVGYPNVDRCKQVTEELGVSESVHFTGQVNYFELPLYLSLADVAVDPKPAGANESSGKILNYMAAGVPIVAFDSINTRDMIGSKGLLVKEESSAGLAATINQLLADPELRVKLSVAARDRISTWYSWDNKIKHAVSTYEKLTH